MNESFETIRNELKKFNAEDNPPPPKLIIAGKNDFPDIEHKRKKNSQFIITVKEFDRTERILVDTLLADIQTRTGLIPLAYFYDEKEAIKSVIDDFEDYYNVRLPKDLFQKMGPADIKNESNFCLMIVVIENHYYSA